VDQIRIDLDRDDFFSVLEQRFGQRALARANFNDQRRTRVFSFTSRKGDSRQDRFAREEVLPQPPPQG
jgi:hypothetical protein